MGWEGHFTSVEFFWKPLNALQSEGKHKTTQLEECATEYLIVTHQNCQDHEKQGK